MPKYELLKEAYAIIGGIPDNVIDLNLIMRERGDSLACGTICCAAGWLAHHPTFQAIGLSMTDARFTEHADLVYRGEELMYAQAMSKVFDMPERDVISLFSSRHYQSAIKVRGASRLTDKDLWLARVRKYLADHGQLGRAS
jgi:hypothetical protein